jgi:SSS family solute:Na+ symporter
MSTVDSTFNSLATLWSTDIYARYIRPNATDRQKIQAGRKAILVSLFTALMMGMVLLVLKFDNPDAAFTHTLNNLRYYINCGIVVLIISAVGLLHPNRRLVLIAFGITLPINVGLQLLLPEMNYFVRAFWVIFSGLLVAVVGSGLKVRGFRDLLEAADHVTGRWGWILAGSLLLLHIVFH